MMAMDEREPNHFSSTLILWDTSSPMIVAESHIPTAFPAIMPILDQSRA